MIDPTAAATTTATQPASASATNQVNKDTFLKLLVAQLKYQNPMSPTDSTQFLQQPTTSPQDETLRNIATQQPDRRAPKKTTQPTGMLGQQATAIGADGKNIAEIVPGSRPPADGPIKRKGQRLNPSLLV